MKKALFTFALLTAMSAAAFAQDRQVEINAELPAKRGLLTSDIALAGRVYWPVGNFVMVADTSFRDAVNLFLTPTANINLEGQAWYYVTGAPSKDASSVKPFVFGGVTRAMFVGQPVDSTAGIAGFGVTYRRPSGFHLIPTFEFNSDDFESNRTVLGREFAAKVYIHIPVGSNFNVNLTPRFARVDRLPGNYQSEYGLSIGFARKF